MKGISRRALVLLAFVFGTVSLFAATPQVQWQRQFFLNGSAEGLDIVQTADGGYGVVGYVRPTDSAFAPKAFLLRLSATGESLWTRLFVEQSANFAERLVVTPDGGFIFGGGTEGPADSFLLVRTDSAGGELWRKVLPLHLGKQLAAYPLAGGYVASGVIPLMVDSSSFVARLDSLGNLIWQRRLALDNWRHRGPIGALPDGSVIAAGTWRHSDLGVARLDSAGNTLWKRKYPDDSIAYVNDIGTVHNDIVLAGCGGGIVGGQGKSRALLLKLDSAGNKVWLRRYGRGGIREDANGVAVAPNGKLFVCGASCPVGAQLNRPQAFVLGVDGSGMLLWSDYVGEPTVWSEAWAVYATADGGCVATGRAGARLLVIKYGPATN